MEGSWGETAMQYLNIPRASFSASTSQCAAYGGMTKLQQFHSGLFRSVGRLSRIWKQ